MTHERKEQIDNLLVYAKDQLEELHQRTPSCFYSAESHRQTLVFELFNKCITLFELLLNAEENDHG